MPCTINLNNASSLILARIIHIANVKYAVNWSVLYDRNNYNARSVTMFIVQAVGWECLSDSDKHFSLKLQLVKSVEMFLVQTL